MSSFVKLPTENNPGFYGIKVVRVLDDKLQLVVWSFRHKLEATCVEPRLSLTVTSWWTISSYLKSVFLKVTMSNFSQEHEEISGLAVETRSHPTTYSVSSEWEWINAGFLSYCMGQHHCVWHFNLSKSIIKLPYNTSFIVVR